MFLWFGIAGVVLFLLLMSTRKDVENLSIRISRLERKGQEIRNDLDGIRRKVADLSDKLNWYDQHARPSPAKEASSPVEELKAEERIEEENASDQQATEALVDDGKDVIADALHSDPEKLEIEDESQAAQVISEASAESPAKNEPRKGSPWAYAALQSHVRSAPVSEKSELEHFLGVKLPVIGGAIMFLVGAFLFLKFIIESNFLTLENGIYAAYISSALFIVFALFIDIKKIANYREIGSALAGTGVLLGYVGVIGAWFHFGEGHANAIFVSCVIIALVAIALSKRFGSAVFVFGVIGAYAAPFFGYRTPDLALAAYLAIVMASTTYILDARKLYSLAIYSLVLPAAWYLVFLFDNFLRLNSGSVFAFYSLSILLAPYIVYYKSFLQADEEGGDKKKLHFWIAAIGSIGGLLAQGALHPNYVLPFWFVSGILVLLLSPALKMPKQHSVIATSVAIITAFTTMVVWTNPHPIGIIFFVLNAGLVTSIISAHQILARDAIVEWSRCMVISILAMFAGLIVVTSEWKMSALEAPFLWAAASLAIAATMSWFAYFLRASERAEGMPYFIAGASGAVSLALVLTINPHYLLMAAGFQVLGLAMISLKLKTRDLNPYMMAYSALYVGLLVLGHWLGNNPEAVAGIDLARFLPVLTVGEDAIFVYLIPGMAFFAAASILALRSGDEVRKLLDCGSPIVMATGLHFMLLPTWRSFPAEHFFGMVWPWFIGLGIFVLGIIAVGRWGERKELSAAGQIINLFPFVSLVTVIFNSIGNGWSGVTVSGIIVLNDATLTMIGYAAVLALMAIVVRKEEKVFMAGMTAIVAFMWVIVSIRHGYHGAGMSGPTYPIEHYTYTAAIMAIAFASLWAGARWDIQQARIASLVLSLVAVGKLFTYDMVGLEGLWRIGSFFGLGASLLAISWFYAKFVFTTQKEEPQA